MGSGIVRRCAVAAAFGFLVLTVAGVAGANQGDPLTLGVTTNDAQGFDTEVASAAPHYGLWVNETGPGVGFKATTGSTGGTAVLDKTANGTSYGVNAVSSASDGTGLHPT